MYSYSPGQTLRFTYNGLREGKLPSDKFKEVLVLHPNWQGKMHGIDLKRLTPAEKKVLDTIMDPAQRGRPQRIPLVRDILKRMDPVEDIKNPVSFYAKFVKVFLRNKDAYRTYYPTRMYNVTVAQQTHVHGTVVNPKPLFHKVESRPRTPAPAKQAERQPNRLELIRQRADAQKTGQKPVTASRPPGVSTSKEPPRPKAPKADRMALIKQRAELTRAKRPK